MNYLEWWLLYLPKKVFTVVKRLVSLVNNQIAFTLNIRLLFTPLFGDYTRAGRAIGFTFRIVEIILGTLLVLALFILTPFSPLIWYLLPVAILLYFEIWGLVAYILVTFAWWYITQRDIPYCKVLTLRDPATASSLDILKTFRPSTLHFLEDFLQGSKNIGNDSSIFYLLKKLELAETDILAKFAGNSFQKEQLLKSAFDYALAGKSRYVEKEHVFTAGIKSMPETEVFLSHYNVSLKVCEEAAMWMVQNREAQPKQHFWHDDYVMPTMGGIGKGMTGRATPNLNSISEDFTEMAKKGELNEIVGRQEEIKRIASILGGSKVNILILGEPGSGKTSIVKGIANEIIRGTQFPSLRFKRIVSVDPGELVAGTTSSGVLAEKLKVVIEEAQASKDIILFVDEIQNLLISDQDGDASIATPFTVLEPHLASGKLQFIGATNLENYRKHIEPSGSFSRLFELVEINQATKEDTVEILKSVSKGLERKYKIIISYLALKKVVELSDKLIHEHVLPDKAIDILDRTASGLANSTKYLTAEDVAIEISQVAKVPVAALSPDDAQKLLTIETELKKLVIGQDPALLQIGAAIKRAQAGIRNESKPIASFLFVGTTGVGKTETAKALAQTYFGDVKTMIRLDMSEYQQLDSISRLVGDPNGGTKGILTEAVRTKPFALILLDEIEKAHPNILQTFLQVLDDGRLTDSSGRVIDFTNTIIIATSNVGTKQIQQVSQTNGDFVEMQTTAMNEVHHHFAPEFLNRFSSIIVFKPLDMLSVKKITELMLAKIKGLAEEKGITVSFKPELVEELIKRGYDPEWGARPLARVIENTVESFLAVNILSNKLVKGSVVDLGLEVLENTTIA